MGRTSVAIGNVYQAQFRGWKEREHASQQTQKKKPHCKESGIYVKVQQELEAAKARIKTQKAEYEKALEGQRRMQGEYYGADRAFRLRKAEYEAKRYDYE